MSKPLEFLWVKNNLSKTALFDPFFRPSQALLGCENFISTAWPGTAGWKWDQAENCMQRFECWLGHCCEGQGPASTFLGVHHFSSRQAGSTPGSLRNSPVAALAGAGLCQYTPSPQPMGWHRLWVKYLPKNSRGSEDFLTLNA